MILCLVFMLSFFFVTASWADEPLPPNDVLDWLEYALKRFPPLDCPQMEDSSMRCAAITEVRFSGDAKSGKLDADFTGYNWSRTEQTLDLVGPSSSFAFENAQVNLVAQDADNANDSIFIAPYFEQAGGAWKIKIPPGKFSLHGVLVFLPKATIPFFLADGVGRVSSSNLSGAYLQYDENDGNHGGETQLILSDREDKTDEKPQVRITRIFQWGSVPMFRYVVQVNGLRNETQISVPLLADESIEKVSPDKSYSIKEEQSQRLVTITFTPNSTQVEISGHFKSQPDTFALSEVLPFEVWLYVSDRRYPANIETNANPIDVSEFANLLDVQSARAFLIKPGEKLSFHPVNLKVDEGRKGKGSLSYEFHEGTQGYWLEKLYLWAKILGQDRLVVPTPHPPVYAGIGSEGIELFHDGNNQLSVRLPAEGLGKEVPIEIDWNETRSETLFFGLFRAELPGQNVYLEEQKATVQFRPGVVPLYAWGAGHAKGDILDQFHLYGFLIGILAFFLCRALGFRHVLSVFVTLLFVGLYLQRDFPTTGLMILLLLTVPIVRVGESVLEKLRGWPLRRLVLQLVWLGAFVITALLLVDYARTRVFEALHPYAISNNHSSYKKYDEYDSDNVGASYKSLAGMANMTSSAIPPVPSSIREDKPNEGKQQNIQNQDVMRMSDWNAKPVKRNIYIKQGESVEFSSFNIIPGQKTHLNVFMAGPVMRGGWMLLECGMILWLLSALIRCARRLFDISKGGAA